jgi:hypothetical protein
MTCELCNGTLDVPGSDLCRNCAADHCTTPEWRAARIAANRGEPVIDVVVTLTPRGQIHVEFHPTLGEHTEAAGRAIARIADQHTGRAIPTRDGVGVLSIARKLAEALREELPDLRFAVAARWRETIEVDRSAFKWL